MFLDRFYADAYYENLAALPLASLYSCGYRVALLDIDNTLEVHGSHQAGAYAQIQVERFKSAGFRVFILSNAMAQRAWNFAQKLDVEVIGRAGKPGIKGIMEASRVSGEEMRRLLLVGDQLFTDIWAAKRAGVASVLLSPLSKAEPWWIRLKRLGERLVMRIQKVNTYYDHLI